MGQISIGAADDLNQDGTPEFWVSAEGYVNVASMAVIALYDGRSCRLIGLFRARRPLQLRLRARAPWPDFEVDEYGIGGEVNIRYRFDGTHYVGHERRVCRHTGDELCIACRRWEPLGDRPYPPEGWGNEIYGRIDYESCAVATDAGGECLCLGERERGEGANGAP